MGKYIVKGVIYSNGTHYHPSSEPQELPDDLAKDSGFALCEPFEEGKKVEVKQEATKDLKSSPRNRAIRGGNPTKGFSEG